MIEDDDLLEKYNTVWDKVSADINKEFDSEPVYNKKFLENQNKLSLNHFNSSLMTCLMVYYQRYVFRNSCPDVFCKKKGEAGELGGGCCNSSLMTHLMVSY